MSRGSLRPVIEAFLAGGPYCWWVSWCHVQGVPSAGYTESSFTLHVLDFHTPAES